MSTNSAAMLETIYKRRFGPDLTFRARMWEILCRRYFQRFIAPSGTVLEVGAGYCEFINSIQAAHKIAVDLNPDTARYANPDIDVFQTSSTDMQAIASGSVDAVFASNFFEHITRDDILSTMREVARVLRPNGRFLVLQPNIRFCWRDFWMFFDHITPLDHHSLTEALEMSGFHAVRTVVRFLPYTTQGQLPKSLFMVHVYLTFPILWRFFGQQTFIVAELGAPENRS